MDREGSAAGKLTKQVQFLVIFKQNVFLPQ